MIQALASVVDEWHPVTLTGARGRAGADLAAHLLSAGIQAITPHEDIASACRAALDAADTGDRIVVLGSFHAVAPVLAAQPWIYDSSLPQSREI